jgi:hypothetical protein
MALLTLPSGIIDFLEQDKRMFVGADANTVCMQVDDA